MSSINWGRVRVRTGKKESIFWNASHCMPRALACQRRREVWSGRQVGEQGPPLWVESLISETNHPRSYITIQPSLLEQNFSKLSKILHLGIAGRVVICRSSNSELRSHVELSSSHLVGVSAPTFVTPKVLDRCVSFPLSLFRYVEVGSIRTTTITIFKIFYFELILYLQKKLQNSAGFPCNLLVSK